MDNIKLTDEWLKKYVPLADKALLEQLEQEAIPTHRFSRKFERKMRKLIRYEGRSPAYRRFCAVMSKAAVFAAILSISGFALTMSVEANRLEFFKSIETVYHDHVRTTFIIDEDKLATKFTPKRPHYIPAGYKLKDCTESSESIFYSFKNEEGEYLYLMMYKLNNSITLAKDSNFVKTKEFKLLGNDAWVLEQEECRLLTFRNDSYTQFEIIASDLSLEELIKIAEGLK